MFRFAIENCNELNSFLQESHIHDSFFQHAIFSQTAKEFHVNVVNNIWNDSLHMVFIDVCQFVSVADYKWGNNETVNCFVVINNPGELPEFFGPYKHGNKLCFVWEMFSGNRIYIACSELKIARYKGDKGTGGQRDGSLS